jgi:hypothetical protein
MEGLGGCWKTDCISLFEGEVRLRMTLLRTCSRMTQSVACIGAPRLERARSVHELERDRR